jgi:hypothetical protein
MPLEKALAPSRPPPMALTKPQEVTHTTDGEDDDNDDDLLRDSDKVYILSPISNRK